MTGTALLHLVKLQDRKLSTTAPDTFWSLLSQLYRAHKARGHFEDLEPLIRSRDFISLLSLADSWTQQKYGSAREHYLRNQFAYLIKKYPGRVKGLDPEATARTKFNTAELVCAVANKRFASWSIDTTYALRENSARDRYSALLRRARSWIQYVIGFEPPIMTVLENVGFGPGANVGYHGNRTHAGVKLGEGDWTMTPRAATYVAACVSQNLWLRRKFSDDAEGFYDGTPGYWTTRVLKEAAYVRYNKLAFVPKTAKTHRTIAVEPLGNSLLQKGIDVVMRQRLLRVGLDLSDQTRNQDYARDGSSDDSPFSFATMDLAAASDTVSRELVKTLLPEPWYALLNACRAEYYLDADKKQVRYEKFCSMGNGFCFPLETLIFAALAHAVGAGDPGRDFLVYGDDIVVRRPFYRPLKRLLRVCGFTTNVEKSFSSGFFRESCGEDWWDGVSVRPFVLDYEIDSVRSVYKFLNQTRERASWVPFFQPVRDYMLRLLPVKLHLYRPFAGPVDSAITTQSVEHLLSPNCIFLPEQQSWKWRELTSRAKQDVRGLLSKEGVLVEPPDFVQWYGAHTLTGGVNVIDGERVRRRGREPWFTLRNTVRTSVTWESHGGATSNWLPLPR